LGLDGALNLKFIISPSCSLPAHTHTHPHTRDGEIDHGICSSCASRHEQHAYTRTACTVECTHKHLDHVIFAIHFVLAGGLESSDTEAG
jgi:hypothetical protein